MTASKFNDQWEQLAGAYARIDDDVRTRFLHPAVEEVVRGVLPSGRTDALLDFGCGPGELAVRLAPLFSRVVIADRAQSTLAIAAARLADRAEAVPPDRLPHHWRFDVIVLSLVLTAVDEDDEALRMLTGLARRLATPDARLVLATTHPCFTFRALAQVSYRQSGGAYTVPIGPIEVTEYHRPLDAVLDLLWYTRARCTTTPSITESVARSLTDSPGSCQCSWC